MAGCAAIVRAIAFETPPCGAGLKTVTAGLPADVRSAAGIDAVSCVELTKVVVRFAPAHCTLELGRKFVPLTVRVMSPEPANTVVGLIFVSVGTGALTVNVCALEVPPVVPGVFTVTGTDAEEATRDAEIDAFNCVLSRKVVGTAVPFQFTTEEPLYPVPVTVRTKPALPARMLPGFRDEIVGAEDETVRVMEFDVLPPSVTVMVKEPAVVSELAGITAVSCEELTKVVVSAVPLKLTTELEEKLEPETVSVVAGEFTVTVETESDEMVGVFELEEDPFPQPNEAIKIARINPTTTARR